MTSHGPEAISVEHATGQYEVVVGPGLLGSLPAIVAEQAPAFRYAVIADEHVASLHASALMDGLHAAGLAADLFTFPPGEASKNRAEWGRLSDGMFAAGFGRDSAVIAFGGGVTGDLAGFVAATFMRGVPVVQVPTSLVAMIDSAVGGKTGIDVPGGKNLVGAFHPPAVVVVDPAVSSTLSPEQRAQGLAEAVKHGAILDSAYFEALTTEAPALLAGDLGATDRAVRRSIALKARVVSSDEREGGLRQILNFGHTVGHALEAASRYGMGHGTAVAAGMVLEAGIGEALGVTPVGTRQRLDTALRRFHLDTRPPVAAPADVRAFLAADKKGRQGRPRFVLLEEVGRVSPGDGWSREVPDDVVLAVLREVYAQV